MLKALLIDDEILALNLLEILLRDIGDVEIVGKFTNFDASLNTILGQQLDVIFLDIEMPGKNGIQIAEQINEINEETKIVFVTAYEQYAIEAFRVHAMDYLLKPIDPARLKQSVEILMKRRSISPQKLTSISVQFFGNFSLLNEHNISFKWRTKKVKELCSYLLHHDEPVHRLKIIEDFWPDIPMEKAKSLLHTTVYQLRKQLKEYGLDNPISLVDERYSINMRFVEDDRGFMGILNNDDFNNGVAHILELLKKGYLGYEDYPWSINAAENIRGKFRTYLDKFLKEQSNQSDKTEMYGQVLEVLIQQDPYNDYYYQELINYFIESGNNKKADEVYSKYKGYVMKK
ncbi:response regulator [Lysinibacillus sp. BW-2-10]|uniref:response regulator n=1 Tax=Lysinibacillus sp. BW-2-10 TaxID=2590030 RepID=UPI00117D6236|nr:response regulator [Lysinibacillus sp. BW-2-10]TSI07364.1 response regulator [Lysinibacillus sp. BW-2-10]